MLKVTFIPIKEKNSWDLNKILDANLSSESKTFFFDFKISADVRSTIWFLSLKNTVKFLLPPKNFYHMSIIIQIVSKQKSTTIKLISFNGTCHHKHSKKDYFLIPLD